MLLCRRIDVSAKLGTGTGRNIVMDLVNSLRS